MSRQEALQQFRQALKSGQKCYRDCVHRGRYPYPQVLDAVADMSHISIIGIKLLTAEYSGDVGVCISLDDGATYSDEVSLGDWLNTDVEELWNSLPESRRVYFHFVLHDNAALSRFKITYIN